MNKLSEAYNAYVDFWVNRIGARNVITITLIKWFILGCFLGLLI